MGGKLQYIVTKARSQREALTIRISRQLTPSARVEAKSSPLHYHQYLTSKGTRRTHNNNSIHKHYQLLSNTSSYNPNTYKLPRVKVQYKH